MQNRSAGAYSSPLHLISCHDDDSGILLPNHLPEVEYCIRQAALCGNVSPLWLRHFTTDVACIDVVRAYNSGVRVLEDNTCVVNCKERRECVMSEFRLQKWLSLRPLFLMSFLQRPSSFFVYVFKASKVWVAVVWIHWQLYVWWPSCS